MPNVLVLGVQGMLGGMVASVLRAHPELVVTATGRDEFDVRSDAVGRVLDRGDFDWVVNAVGVLKARIDERDASSIENAIAVNAVFPHLLATQAAERGTRVVQIATDGVFSGLDGPYDESALHDTTDVYGKTKSLGEVPSPNVVHLRCSIVGPAGSLLGWALSLPAGTRVAGYTAHRWNGVTTLQFAKLCVAVIAGLEVPAVQHVVPADTVSKAELLELALAAFGRDDLTVSREPGAEPVDRTLATTDPEANRRLWRAAGYERPPTIAEMVRELAATVQ